MIRTTGLLAAAFSLGLIAAPAMAQQASSQEGSQGTPHSGSSGVTSGPAAGTNVVPGTVTQKNGDNDKSSQPGVSAGAPGMAGAPGNENGPKPK